MQDVPPPDVSALCAACHELSQIGAPLIVVGAGLPHLPAVLSASKSYSERLFRYQRIDRLDRVAADRALLAPAEREGVEFTPEALDALYEESGGYPYFVQAYGKATWDARRPARSPRTTCGSPRRGGGRAGGRVLRLPVRAGHAGRARVHAGDGRARRRPGRHRRGRRLARPQAGQPVPGPGRLIKKGLIYSGERGLVAFTVPHFGRYLRTQPA